MIRNNLLRNLSSLSLPPACSIKYKPAAVHGETVCIAEYEDKRRNILVLKKPNDPGTAAAEVAIISFLLKAYPYVKIIVEPDEDRRIDHSNMYPISLNSFENEYEKAVDLVITLGGDGTILHASSLFPRKVPPIMSFSLGSLGFLIPFSNMRTPHCYRF